MEADHLVGTWMCNLPCSSFHQGTSFRSRWRQTSTIERKRSSLSYQASQRAKSKQRLEARNEPQLTGKKACRSKLEEGLNTSFRTCIHRLVLE